MKDVDFDALTKRFLDERGSLTHVMEAACAVANALQIGVGQMIKGTFMEQDLRNALCLRDGEAVNFRRSKRGGSTVKAEP